MLKKLIFIYALCSLTKIRGQALIDVADNTFKVAGKDEAIFYYGFAEGDQLIFNFEEIDGKQMKEIEIIELSGSSKFMDYKSKRVENKTINVSKTAIYKFRFTNEALLGRVCKFKIQRIPGEEKSMKFSTDVYWRTTYDTTYNSDEEKYLISSDTSISNIVNQVAKVHSVGNMNGNVTAVNFTLPGNVHSWSYYIGVDQTGQQALDRAASELSKTLGSSISKIPGYGPMAALALDAVCFIPRLQGGEDIDFLILQGDNIDLYMSGRPYRYIQAGRVINDFSKVKSASGNHLIRLSNDNAVTGVDVTVVVTAITIDQRWGQRTVKKILVTPRNEAYLKND